MLGLNLPVESFQQKGDQYIKYFFLSDSRGSTRISPICKNVPVLRLMRGLSLLVLPDSAPRGFREPTLI